MRRYILLSYKLNINSPLYPNTPAIEIKKDKSIRNGDSCNTFIVKLSNHSGTHIDAPAHFLSNGKTITEYSFKDFHFSKPVIVDCKVGYDKPITVSMLNTKLSKNSYDSLIIRTGFQELRSKRPKIYKYHNPYITPETAIWLRNKHPEIRILAIDCISITNYKNRSIGKEVHKILLSEKGFASKPILILEDIFIPKNLKSINELIVCPFLLEGIDSSFCNVIGVIND